MDDLKVSNSIMMSTTRVEVSEGRWRYTKFAFLMGLLTLKKLIEFDTIDKHAVCMDTVLYTYGILAFGRSTIHLIN